MGTGAWRGGGGDILLINYTTTVSTFTPYNSLFIYCRILFCSIAVRRSFGDDQEK